DFYEFCYARHRIIWLFWWLLLGIVIGFYLAFLRPKIVASHSIWVWRGAAAAVVVGGVALIASLPALLFSGLFYVRFRYLARWAACAAGTARKGLSTGWLRALLQLIGVALAAGGFYRLTDKTFHASQVLTATGILKLIAITALLRILWWAFETSSRLVILPFSNYAGDTLKVSTETLRPTPSR